MTLRKFSNYIESLESNSIATANLLENLNKYEQFVYISTKKYMDTKKGLLFNEKLSHIQYPLIQ